MLQLLHVCYALNPSFWSLGCQGTNIIGEYLPILGQPSTHWPELKSQRHVETLAPGRHYFHRSDACSLPQSTDVYQHLVECS